MSELNISASYQNYLKTIWTLAEWSEAPITASDIAQRAKVKISSASDAIKRLKAQGLVAHTPYGAVSLTALGKKLAIEVVRRHRLIETYLVAELGYTWDQVHTEADNLEHYVSDFFISKIEAKLGYPQTDPHGDPIPNPAGKIEKSPLRRLTDLKTGTKVVVKRVFDDDPKLLQYFAAQGIEIGSQLTVKGNHPYADATEYETEQQKILTLGKNATDAVLVEII
ncbi:metal-dependent transcriptional regulator [Gleimia sp. 6138-11-ORH1]|uniref:metal-dependent transcriptional regulator n=1 Tax=Gleimia sp. 6138-11-ORH1 TaxID=2973937 RepID=UPI002167C8CD|nr:metal-dependent transcriptional regulator [Gleimia sp. 6138-11-ORH1]MCS4484949.1 metal-dependent transcriptional regulator [Gleimia sp. 6138-11-ORH1]